MIEKIFLPEKIGNRYLFRKQVVGIEIRKAEVVATKITVQGTDSTLDLSLQEPLTQESGSNQQERVQAALKALAVQLGSYNSVHTCLPNSMVVFKELQLPFSDPDKIKLALPFEIEGLLPFSLKETTLDSIVTNIDPETGQTTVLAAAVRTQHLAEHLALFAGSGISPDIITVDFFALYGLYKAIPTYAELTHGVVLISLDTNSTRIAYVYNGTLKLIRTINHGVAHIAKAIGAQSEQTTSNAIEQLLRFGIAGDGNAKHQETIHEALVIWWRTIELTLTSFASQSTDEQMITKLLLLGKGAQIDGITDFITGQFQKPCELFNGSHITETGLTLANKKLQIAPNTIISLGAAFPSPLTAHFNLQPGDAKDVDNTLFLAQLGTACLLSLLLISSLCAHLVIQRYQHGRELADSQQEAMSELQKRFPQLEEDEPADLEDAISIAKTELHRGEEIWFRFGPEQRPAQYLVALTNLIDREKLGFTAERISIQGDIITLKASVQDHDAIGQLEKALRDSKQFRPINSPPEPEFTIKIAVPELSKRGT